MDRTDSVKAKHQKEHGSVDETIPVDAENKQSRESQI